MRYRRWLPVVAIVVLSAVPAAGDSILFVASGSGIGDNPLEAAAFFEIVGNTLTVTLTNSSLAVTEIPAELLTGVYFDWAGNPLLTPMSAVLAPGSQVLFGTTDPGGVVGGEFAFRDDLSSGFNGAQYGISNSGMDDVFGPGDRFPGSDLSPPTSPDGPNYGIISAGGLGDVDNSGPLSGTLPLIDNSVVFTFAISGYEFSVIDISNVSFQYGTSQSEPSIPTIPVPEPATISIFGIGLAAMASRRLRKQA